MKKRETVEVPLLHMIKAYRAMKHLFLQERPKLKLSKIQKRSKGKPYQAKTTIGYMPSEPLVSSLSRFKNGVFLTMCF